MTDDRSDRFTWKPGDFETIRPKGAPTPDAQQASENVDWPAIEKFVGYGRRDAPVVFIGMEEGHKAGADLTANLVKRSGYESVRPLHPEQRTIQPTWGVMSEVMLRRSGVARPSAEDKRQYQLERLGDFEGDTLLTELLPYPKRRSNEWPDVYKCRFRTRDKYIAVMVPHRLKMLREVLSEAPRELIVIYGKEHADRFEPLFGPIPRGKVVSLRPTFGARVILTPHFVSHTFSDARKEFFELCLEPS